MRHTTSDFIPLTHGSYINIPDSLARRRCLKRLSISILMRLNDYPQCVIQKNIKMALYIEAKVRFEKVMENGKVRKISEPYLVDALSFTEAEARITEEVMPYISGEFTVSAVKKTKIAEIFRDEKGGYWYMIKANFISLDEKGVEKLNPTYFLVQASDFPTAYNNFMDGMKGTMADFTIAGITETKIMDVFDAK